MSTLFETTLEELGTQYKLIHPYTPRHNGKIKHSRRKDNGEFYACHTYYFFPDFKKQLAVRPRRYKNFPMRPRNQKSPNVILSSYQNSISYH